MLIALPSYYWLKLLGKQAAAINQSYQNSTALYFGYRKIFSSL
jgi:hypothetical protein